MKGRAPVPRERGPERLALTPTLSRKREREKDQIPSPREAGRGLGRGVRDSESAFASWRYYVLLLGRGRVGGQ